MAGCLWWLLTLGCSPLRPTQPHHQSLHPRLLGARNPGDDWQHGCQGVGRLHGHHGQPPSAANEAPQRIENVSDIKLNLAQQLKKNLRRISVK